MDFLKRVKEDYHVDFSSYPRLEDEVKSLKSLVSTEDYFTVIILAQQLMEKFIDEIDEGRTEHWKRKTHIVNDDELELYNILKRVQQDEAIKPRFVRLLLELHENDHHSGIEFSRNDFIKYFTKLECLIKCRNDLAHEFYKKEFSQRKLKQTANEAIELIELLIYCFCWF